MLRIGLTGGGSGGHIYTLLAVAENLKKIVESGGESIELRYFGDPKEYEPRFAGAGIKITHITPSKLRRYFSILTIIDLFKFVWSIPQALFKLLFLMPDVLFSKGGPGALPVLYAARFYRIPIVIHDSDAIPGLTTRLSQKFSKIIELAFPKAIEYISNKSAGKVVGNPVRNEVLLTSEEKTPDGKTFSKSKLDFNPDMPLILIIGGSLGAGAINECVLGGLRLLLARYQILHQIGINNFDEYIVAAKKELESLPPPISLKYKPVPFLQSDMRHALSAADIIISRAGAGAIFEIAASEKPSILIPLENSANNHQKENAFAYEDAGACVIIEEANLFPDILITEIDKILNNPEQLLKMKESAKNFYRPNAAQIIATDLINLAKS